VGGEAGRSVFIPVSAYTSYQREGKWIEEQPGPSNGIPLLTTLTVRTELSTECTYRFANKDT
jgi:hypothetical protein